MDAIITAGGIPLPGEPLYEYTRGQPKAMLDICGKPMIQWVLDAVSHARGVENIVIIGLTELGGVTCPKPVTFIPDQAGMLENVTAGMNAVRKIHPEADRALLIASDIPAITSEMVEWLIDLTAQHNVDIIYNVVDQPSMEKMYPTSRRTYTHLKDVSICGGDMNAVKLSMIERIGPVWQSLIAARKNPLKQASILGFNILFALIFRTTNLEETVNILCKRLGITGYSQLSPFAEVGMDVDKPHQLEIMRADMARRHAA